MKIEDTPFDDAPGVVLKALVQLSHMGKLAVESSQQTVKKLVETEGYQVSSSSTLFDAWKQPNEVLVLAYMEKDSISVSILTSVGSY